jgi:hypothetical protein
MLQELISEWRSQAAERVRNPLLGAFTGAWLVINWRLVAVLLLSDTSIEDRISSIEMSYLKISNLLYHPLLVSLSLVLFLPWVNLGIQLLQELANVRRRKHKLRIDTEYLKASVGRAEAQAQLNLILAKEQITKNQQEEIATLRKQLQEQQEGAQARVTAREAELEKARKEYEELAMAEGADAEKQRQEVQKVKTFLEGELQRAQSERDHLMMELRSRQQELEKRILKKDEQPSTYSPEAIMRMLLSTPYRLYFNPKRGPQSSKKMIFLPNGKIVEGGNQNEHSWRLVGDKLELLQEDGAVHSRFFCMPGNGIFLHTNDDDTKSLRNQYMIPERR